MDAHATDFTLDFSTLTDDQLVGLLRSVLRECVARGGAVQAAARSAGIDEAERAQIAKDAAEREAAKLRAKERERVAKDAAERVKQERAAQEAAAQAAENVERLKREAEASERARQGAIEAGRIAAQQARMQAEQEKTWLRRAAALVGRDPKGICLLYLRTNYGVRVLINPSTNRYDENHLADWNAEENRIKTVRELIGRKPDLTAFCAEFRAAHKPDGQKMLFGSEYTWEDQ
jgi:hypothetical protein